MARSSKKVITTVYLNPDQKEQPDQLSAKTRVPISAFVREGIDQIPEPYKRIIGSNEKTVEIVG